MKPLTHLNSKGESRMVDVGLKTPTRREARARGEVRMSPGTVRRVVRGKLPKGDVFAAARLAGILAAKRTDEIIPLCHSLPLDSVAVDLEGRRDRIRIEATARTHAKTGVEMEALTAVAAACLTIYDMAKAVDRGIVIGPIFLAEKKGGRSGHYRRRERPHGG